MVPARARPLPPDEAEEPLSHRELQPERGPAPPLSTPLREQDAATQPQGRREDGDVLHVPDGGPAESVSGLSVSVHI